MIISDTLKIILILKKKKQSKIWKHTSIQLEPNDVHKTKKKLRKMYKKIIQILQSELKDPYFSMDWKKNAVVIE